MGSGSSLHSDHGSSSGKGKTNNGIRKQMKKEFGADEQQHNEEEVQNNENVVKNDTSINPAIFKARKLFMKPIIKGRPLQQQVVIKKQVGSNLQLSLLVRIFWRNLVRVWRIPRPSSINAFCYCNNCQLLKEQK